MEMTYEFSKEDLAEIEKIKAKYPDKKSPVMPVLWLAQEKFGHVEPEVQQLVARTLDLPAAHVYGVVSFYTQYYGKKMGKYVLDVCTTTSCQLCGGYEILHYIEDKLGIKAGETTKDGLFSIQSVECLGACGYAPMMQITNGVYCNHLTKEKVDTIIDGLRAGRMPEFESIPMPQHLDESTNKIG
ncbi:MAG: NAD(P)H-dependent oxidoreductase subunit E [Candidatus Cyclonatronum sp.]|uniref:NADH-quinone oxidoreductase subunit NuoE family protein n=1 Tax=Cyclonatronum sp. TaxID=3024185 RepID=UPI0025BA0336|nr:NAD(P)H-dependent oxidoreductase subunit E [Cyclonatronum sp.]MCC5933109.1 NAD(P)H-dependent oxidoreductase subunit E [Balneolales bacterium]MCH8486668.1 NAD(P)H-dependent oxidoreductase subunit E [Cyclonatronum sp.]